MKNILFLIFSIWSITFFAQNNTKIHHAVDKNPEPALGDKILLEMLDSMSATILTKTKFDCNSTENQSKVYVGIVIDKGGKITGCQILRGLDKEVDNEVIERCKDLELEWNPGLKDNKPVDCDVTLVFNICPERKGKKIK